MKHLQKILVALKKKTQLRKKQIAELEKRVEYGKSILRELQADGSYYDKSGG